MVKVKRALISVYDKRGMVELAKGLQELRIEILSTGGTAQALREAGVSLTEVSDLTGFPEMLDGRVKTLHPKIHGGILFKRGEAEHERQIKAHAIKPIDLVVVNLYPFELTASRATASEEEVIEHIDIGGPTLIRSASKNFQHVTVVTDPEDYPAILQELKGSNGEISYATRRRLMIKAFSRTSSYDWAIVQYFAQTAQEFPEQLALHFQKAYDLRYGENPHQKAQAYRRRGEIGIFDAPILCGKQMSSNNFFDADSALSLIREFYGNGPAVVILKHMTPCGGATGKTLKEAYQKALASDPLSAFGGVIAFSQKMDKETAAAIGEHFYEVLLAPGFEPGALALLTEKKNRRIMDITHLIQLSEKGKKRFTSVLGGVLFQEADSVLFDRAQCKVPTKKQPTEGQWRAMEFAMKVCKHARSNAVVISGQDQVYGVGAGETSRVDAVKVALAKAKENKFELKGATLASDAFFPFRDSIDLTAKEGIAAVVQPGGSVKDDEVIKACDEHGMTMVFTGVRHFRHH